MPSIQNELVEELRAKNASVRDIAYAAANIPIEFWNITRNDIEVTSKNKPIFSYVTEYVDSLHNMISDGKGLTMLGSPKSGKTLFGCAILKSAAINPKSMRRDYHVIRVNYDTIIEDFEHLKREQDSYMELRNNLTRANILFIDSLSFTIPPGVLLSIARTRRDFKKSTILATSIELAKLQSSRIQEIIDVFRDVNKVYSVDRH